MRTLSPSLSHQVAGRFVRPAYLVELDYKDATTPLRYVCGITSLLWSDTTAAKTWTRQDISLKGLGWEIKNSPKMSLEIQNIDSEIATALLNNSVADRPIKIWIIYLYDRHILYAGAGNTSGSSQVTVTQIIPNDVAATGNLYYGATDVLADTNYVAYTSIAGRTFNLTGTLTVTLSEGHPVYILNSSYAADDAVQIFDGVFDEIDLDEKNCTILLYPESSATMFTPRRRIIKSSTEPMFSVLPQTGLKILWGTELFTLERADY
jgi:hypothetical protein